MRRCGVPSAGRTAAAASAILIVAATPVTAQEVTTAEATQGSATAFNFGKAFTFLFLTLGPFKVIGPFALMTRGRDAAFKRRLALDASAIAALALLAAATFGAMILKNWGISIGALELTAGIILFLVALRPVLEQFTPHEPEAPAPQPAATSARSTSDLAFSPLAFPTIVTPYGIAVLIMLVTLRSGDTASQMKILGVTAVVLALDLLAMLSAERILATPLAGALGILGAVMGVLQVALGLQATVIGLRLPGVVGGG